MKTFLLLRAVLAYSGRVRIDQIKNVHVALAFFGLCTNIKFILETPCKCFLLHPVLVPVINSILCLCLHETFDLNTWIKNIYLAYYQKIQQKYFLGTSKCFRFLLAECIDVTRFSSFLKLF